MSDNHRKDEIGVQGCEYAVSMVKAMPVEHEDHEHYIGYVASTLRWQANRIEALEAAVRAVRDAPGDSGLNADALTRMDKVAELYALVVEA